MHRGYYMEKNRQCHTVSTEKKLNHSDHHSLRYKRKRDGLVCGKPNRRIFAYISSQRGPIDLSFFALKPCAIASSFPYNNPYVFKISIFSL